MKRKDAPHFVFIVMTENEIIESTTDEKEAAQKARDINGARYVTYEKTDAAF